MIMRKTHLDKCNDLALVFGLTLLIVQVGGGKRKRIECGWTASGGCGLARGGWILGSRRRSR